MTLKFKESSPYIKKIKKRLNKNPVQIKVIEALQQDNKEYDDNEKIDDDNIYSIDEVEDMLDYIDELENENMKLREELEKIKSLIVNKVLYSNATF
jgi:hypothetical protein